MADIVVADLTLWQLYSLAVTFVAVFGFLCWSLKWFIFDNHLSWIGWIGAGIGALGIIIIPLIDGLLIVFWGIH